jgi:adenylate cyclase
MLGLGLLGRLDGPELSAVNLAFQVRGAQAPASPVVIVAIDDASFSLTGLQWPWPRTYFAQIVDRLAAAGARVIALDVFFFEPEEFGKPATYTVQGETLKQIAEHYGLELSDLVQANGLATGAVCAGHSLIIPTTPPQQHVVIRDSLADLALRYQVDPNKLLTMNGLNDPCALQPGQVLRVPVIGSVIHVVGEGETVAGIAAAYQINPLAVANDRGQLASDPLTRGQIVIAQFGDAALAAAIQAAGNVVLNGEIQRSEAASTETLNKPLSMLDRAATGFGLVNTTADADGAVHRALLWDTNGAEVFYSWPLRIASLYSGQPLPDSPSRQDFRFGGLSYPIETRRLLLEKLNLERELNSIHVNFLGPAGTVPTYSAFQVLNGDLPPETFADKIVLIGATSQSLHDTFATPFVTRNPPGVPGVEINASALDTFLTGQAFQRAGQPVLLLSALIAGAVALLLITIRRTTLGVSALVGLMLAYGLAWLGAFVLLRLELPIVAPLTTLFAAFALPAVERAVGEELEKRRVRGLFELFISPEMVGQLIDQGVDAMRGQRAELTILFSDIRGFTTMSEKMTPEELVNLLNEYLGVMTDVIHRNGGTVDKYEGDLVMAFFGAPVAHADHAQRAVQTAIEMRQELDRLRARWAAEGKPSSLEMGIGLNSGEVFVGLIGSGRRVNYTVMGDAVNLASRLQDLTKDLHWPLLISEFTYGKIKDDFDAEFSESRLVKGKTVPVRIYKVLGRKGAPETERVRPLYA